MSKHWIQTAITHKGAATKSAEREGLTVHAWCEKHKSDSGVTGHRARLGLTLESLHHHDSMGSGTDEEKDAFNSAVERNRK